MRYKSFRIQNFKGVKDTTVDLNSVAGANVFALVGLNESGKTTVLEAIHSFAPDNATGELLGGETGVPFVERVPRHLISEFTGDVSVLATILASPSDKKAIAKDLASQELLVDIDSIPNEMVLQRQQRFQNGDFKGTFFTLRTKLKVKSTSRHKWRDPTSEESVKLRDAVFARVPSIAYFPTFVFDFPASFFLTNRGGTVDQFYRSVFQDILDYDGRGAQIDRDIVRRVRAEAMVTPWVNFLQKWSTNDDRQKLQHIMDRAGAAVTQLVFGRWNKIFGEDSRGKEVVISYEMIEGEKKDSSGTKIKTNEHDVVAKFQIRDGTRRFDVNDRSLGFRWFFSFMLFTQFRVARSGKNSLPLMFLFDEPASNLHAAAQQRLIECFPEIAKGEHMLVYSTHSHYMIEPKWLEQTFIVTNRADAPSTSMLDQLSLDDESLDIQVASYRSFVNQHPQQISYFQPILDRLEVIPSRFDSQRASIVVEGKSDYFILRYFQSALGLPELPLLPGLGAGTFGALASLHVGWNLQFLFLLDGDRQGKIESDRYADEYGVSKQDLTTLTELNPAIVVIEDLLDSDALNLIQSELQLKGRPTKGQIKRFFQERLAIGNVTSISATSDKNAKLLLEALQSKLNSRV